MALGPGETVDKEPSELVQLAELASSDARAAKKAEWIKNAIDAALAAQKTSYTFERKDGSKLTVEQTGYGVLDLAKNRVVPATEGKTPSVWVRMRIDGEYENGDGWYGFTNPPIQVPDGTYKEDTDSKTGEKAQVANFKVDIPASMRRLLGVE